MKLYFINPPKVGNRFKYTFPKGEKVGMVTSSRRDEIGDIVVEVQYDDGGTDIFWNNSFVDSDIWRGEKIEIFPCHNTHTADRV